VEIEKLVANSGKTHLWYMLSDIQPGIS